MDRNGPLVSNHWRYYGDWAGIEIRLLEQAIKREAALRVEDCRCRQKPVAVNLQNIPTGTVFQGTIGSVRGTFKCNQGYVFQLDGSSLWDLTRTGMACDNYQPIHGRIVIERNA